MTKFKVGDIVARKRASRLEPLVRPMIITQICGDGFIDVFDYSTGGIGAFLPSQIQILLDCHICSKHPKYKGLRKPTTKLDCECDCFWSVRVKAGQ